VMRRLEAGVHLKTAGTTWLEVLIGLAEAGGEGLELAKDIYVGAFTQIARKAPSFRAGM
jgi:tagaturonate epimerase